MAKKLIITEEQYSRLQSKLTESTDINNTIKQAKIGDVLSFKGVNSILKVKVVNINPTNGDVMGETDKGDKVTFNINSYNQTTKMINFKIYDSNKQQVIDTPFQLNSIENLGGTANQTQQPQPNNGEQPKPEQGSEVDDEYVPGTVYNAIKNDPDLRKLMHHTPWWDSFVSELMSKKAEGTGIINALNFFSSYQNEKLNKLLGDGFIVDKWAEFEVLEPVTFYFPSPTGKSEDLEFNVGSRYLAKNQSLNLNDREYNYRVLSNAKYSYKIFVKEKTNEQHVFNCNITKYYKGKHGELNKMHKENVKIKFILSEGYRPTNNS